MRGKEKNGLNRLAIIFSAFVILLVFGTIAYHFLEGLGWVDSFYFTSVTLLKIGYGDIVPNTSAGKILSVFLSLAGITLLLCALFVLVTRNLRKNC